MNIFEMMKPIGIINSSIGEIAVFDLSISDQIDIAKELNNKLDSASLQEFITAFVRHTCHKKENLDNSLSKPKEHSLALDEISKLTFDDLETIAKLYIEKNEYLYKESQTTTKKDAEGKETAYFSYGKINYPMEQGENFQEYLFRLSILEEKRNIELIQKTLGPLTEFSKSLQKSIKQNLTLGEQLSKAFKSFQSIKVPKVETVITKQPEIDYAKFYKPEPQLLTISEVSSKLDTLIDISAEYVQFIIEANKIQTGISEELKRSSDTTTKYSKSNITLSRIILLISFLSLAYGIFSTISSNKSNKIVFKEIVNRFDTLIKSTSNSQKYYLDFNQKLINFKTQLDSLKISSVRLKNK